jgi:hypothetical protein
VLGFEPGVDIKFLAARDLPGVVALSFHVAVGVDNRLTLRIGVHSDSRCVHLHPKYPAPA